MSNDRRVTRHPPALRDVSPKGGLTHGSPVTRHPFRRQARRTLRYHFKSRLTPAPRRLVPTRPGARTLSLLLLIICAGALYFMGTSEMFFVESILVEDNLSVPTKELVDASEALHVNILFLRLDEIEERVRKLADVSDASVSYEWPNILHVHVVERKPILVWESGKQSAWVDESGHIFPARSTLTNTLAIRDVDNQARTEIDARLLVLAKLLPATFPAVKRLDYSESKGLSFSDERGWRIILGQPEQLTAKLAMVQALSAHLIAQKIEPEYIDVRLPERAFYKTK